MDMDDWLREFAKNHLNTKQKKAAAAVALLIITALIVETFFG